MPIKTAARIIGDAARLVTYRLPYERAPRASQQATRVMGANAWHSTLWAVRGGNLAEELDAGIIPGEYRDAAAVERFHIETWARKHGLPEGAQLAAQAIPVVIDTRS